MIPYILGGLGAALGYYLFQTEADYKRGLALLAKNGDDPTGNIVVGAYLAGQGKWDEAMPYLAKSSLKDVTDAVTKDQAGAPNGKLDQLDCGDTWATAAVKVSKYKKQFNDRAMFWYLQCFPVLDEPFKTKLRARVKQIQAKPVSPLFRVGPVAGWNTGGHTGIGFQYAVSGRQSAYLEPDPKADNSYLWSVDVPVTAGKDYELSAWILTDSTEGLDQIFMPIFMQGRKLVDQPTITLTNDLPIWKKYSVKGTFPAGAVTCSVRIQMASKAAGSSVWADDVSVKVDNKEILKNSSFD